MIRVARYIYEWPRGGHMLALACIMSSKFRALQLPPSSDMPRWAIADDHHVITHTGVAGGKISLHGGEYTPWGVGR